MGHSRFSSFPIDCKSNSPPTSPRLQRFEKTNEMLLNCNALSASRLKLAGEEFKKHSKLLGDMKKDLDYIFKKIRNIKAKISAQYPDAFAAAQPKSRQSYAEEADDESIAAGAVASATSAVVDAEATGRSSSAATSKSKVEKRKSGNSSASKVSIDYVQIAEQSPIEGGQKSVVGEEVLRARRSMGSSSTENSNDSSDDTN